MKTIAFMRPSLEFALALGIVFSSRALPLQPATAIDAAATPAAGGGGDSWRPIITPDGRYVLFASRADNLVLSGTNGPFVNQAPKINVFLRDRTNGTTTLVSVNLNGTGPGNGDSIPTGLSTNGQFALFESSAGDLIPGDTNNATDVFLRDLVNDTNQLVSISAGGGFGNGASWESVMTPDGRYVAFASAATNLVANDTNGIQDVFVRDLQLGVTTLASPAAKAVSTALVYATSSDSPQITTDGRYVVFRSSATNLVNPSSSLVNEVYVRDLVGGATILASTNAHRLFSGTPYSYNQVISGDGQYVAFETSLPTSSTAGAVIQRYNLQTEQTDDIFSNAVATFAFNHFRTLDMTPDGRFVTFVGSTNTGSGTNTSCVFVWDAQSGLATLVNTNLAGFVSTNSVCDFPTIDPTGRWIAFISTATNLTTNVVAGEFHLYLHDAQTGVITLVNAETNGVGQAKEFLSRPVLTPDGRFAAFDCSDTDRVANDNNRAFDVFVNDLTVGTSELISARQPTLPSQTPAGATLGSIFSMSSDGRYVAFSGSGGGLLAGGYTNAYRGVFVRDQLNGSNILVSVDTNGWGGADGWSFDPSISADGRYVAFTSSADNLVPGDSNNGRDVFVRDLQTGVTTLVSQIYNGTTSATGPSYSPSISTDGRYVLFHSKAYNLVPGGSLTASAPENLFERDLQLATNYAVTANVYNLSSWSVAAATPDLRYIAVARSANAGAGFVIWDTRTTNRIYTNNVSPGSVISSIAISPDGNRIAYGISSGFYGFDRVANSNWLIAASVTTSRAGLQFSGDSHFFVYATTNAQVSGDTNGVADIYLHDFQTHSNSLISQSSSGSGAANGISDAPAISADGRFIAFHSLASNIVAVINNGQPNVFVFDRQGNTNTLVSVSTYGSSAGNNRSLAPAFSANSKLLAFQSWSSDLANGDFNQSADLFSLQIYPAIAPLPFIGQLIFAPLSSQTPTISWPAVTNKTYQVQYKNDLSDPLWQNLNSSITMVSNYASVTDPAPGAGQRFYRILAY